jgi:hypothetical protein
MQNEANQILRCSAMLLGLVLGSTAISHAQRAISSSPDPSAGVQYVAPICTGGSSCTNLNDGLSPGSAKWDTDAGKAIDDAYAALPPTGGVIYLLSFGGCSGFSTPIDLNTQGKYVTMIGTGVNTTWYAAAPTTNPFAVEPAVVEIRLKFSSRSFWPIPAPPVASVKAVPVDGV